MRDWNTKWDGWKVGHFATLQTENMEGTTQETFKKIQKLQRELKVGQETEPVRCHQGGNQQMLHGLTLSQYLSHNTIILQYCEYCDMYTVFLIDFWRESLFCADTPHPLGTQHHLVDRKVT